MNTPLRQTVSAPMGVAALAMLAAGLPAPAADAADLVNQDNTTYEIIVINDGNERALTLQGMDAIPDICDSCIIELNDDVSVEVTPETDAVMIQDGQLTTE